MRKHDSFPVVLAFAFFVWPVAIHAQAPPSQITSSNDTGVKPYAPYGGVRENISLTNGNLNLQVPLISLPGRKGNNVALNLIYDSKFWVLHGGYDETMNVAEYWWEWENMGAVGGPSGWRLNLPRISPGPYEFSGGYTACYMGAIVSLSDGSKHSFRNRVGCSPPSAGLAVTDSEDNAFLRLDTSYEDNVVLHMKDGTRIYFPSIESQANKIVDPDGNVTTIQQVSGESTITDTLGRQVTINSAGVTYKDPGGVQRTIAFNYTLLNLAPTFTEPRERSLPNPTQVVVHKPAPGDYALLTSVVLPNNHAYLFQYNTFGELTQITYPTGGYSKYSYSTYVIEWETYPNSADFREVTERRVCANTSGTCDPVTEEKVTTYTPTIYGNQNRYMNVLDADGNLTRHEFGLGSWGGWGSRYNATVEIKKWIYQGQSTLLRTIETQYNQLGYGGSPQSYSLPISVTTTLNDSNQVSRMEYTYDTYSAQIITPGVGSEWLGVTPTARSIDNPIEVREFDYGIGAPGGLARRTVNTWLKVHPINSQDYHSTAIHILDRKTSEVTYDGAGTLKAQSQFEYDFYAEGIMASGAVQHEPSFNTGFTFRGNLTASKRWRNTDGAWAETRNLRYDDAGNVLKTRDPGQHITQFDYADSWNSATNYCLPAGNAAAYVTRIINALGHFTTSTYNSCAGTVASTTDPNNQTTDFTYDLMNRLVRTTLPPDAQGNRGQTDVFFNEPAKPLSVTTTTKITPSMNLVSTVTMDGLGREALSSLDSDPQGVTRTITEYDALGRKATVSNPYRTTSDTTYGLTRFCYDALGRARAVTPPDGTPPAADCSGGSNLVHTDYSGNMTTVTDQAGKQRRSYTDAMGRFIEVDEPSGGGPGLPGSGSATVSGTLQGTGGSATPGTGSATVNGSEQSIQGTSATPGTGSVNITGSEQSWGEWVYLYDECVLYGDEGCLQWQPVYTWVAYYDYGGVSITVNGATKSVSYVSISSGNSIGTALANAINGDSNYPVTASVNGTVVNLTSKATGTASNYSLSATSWTDDPGHFSGPSFVPVRSGPTLTGGTNATPTVYDTGSVWVTVNGSTKTVTYGQGSTNTSVATALRDAMNGDGSYPVSASLSGSTVNLTARTTGASTNYSLSGGSSTSQPGSFSQPSFTNSFSGSALTGGSNGSPFDAGTVSVIVNNAPGGQFTAQVNYSQGSTSASVASALASALNAANSPVTATTNGSVLSITAKAIGVSSNYTLSSSSNSSVYPSPSFTVTTNGLSGGADYTPGTLATPAVTLYSYDMLDNLLSVLQSGSRPRTFTYNSLSQLLTATNPESGTISYTYDNDGNLLTKVSPAPNQTNPAVTVTTTFSSYDELHRLKQKSYSDTTPLVKYTYDGVAYLGCTSELSTSNSIGRRTAMCDGAGQESWSYDALGHVLTDRRITNSVTKDFAYTYNLDGSIATLVYPGTPTRTITYSYNAAAQAVSAVDVANGVNYATGASYAPTGALALLANGASLVSTYYYNNRLQPCRLSVKSSGTAPSQCSDTINVGNVLDFTYGFNLGVANNGNVAFIANNRAPNRSQSFTYDEMNRIKTAQSAATSGGDCWGLQFGYDIWANLLSGTVTKCSAPPLSVGVNTKNQINNANFQYDAVGNLTFDGSLNSTYDAENRIVSTNAGVTYSYDGDGKRLKKSNGKLYWYGSGSDALEETNLSGVASADFIFFGGKRTARLDLPGAAMHYYFANHLGSASVVTSSTGAIQDESDYYPFGGERAITDTDPNQYKFTGKERDTESGLDYFGARYFSSGYGRFVSADLPFADQDPSDPQSWNLYAYVRNNPLRLVDPDGQGAWDVIKGVAEGAANFAVNTVVAVGQVAVAIGNDGGRVGYNTSQLVVEPLITAGQEYSNRGVSGVANAVLDQGEQGATAIVTEAVLTGGLAATARVNSIKSVSGVQANRAAGLKFQAQVLESEGLPPNTRPIQAVDPKTGKPGTTVPDAVRPNGQTVDVKGGRVVSDSPQLRRQSQISAQAGKKAQVIVSNKNKNVSPSVQERMEVKKYPE